MPRLRFLAGPSLDALTPLPANSDSAVAIRSDAFEGRVAVYIADASDPAYFRQRRNVSWSIQVQGRFLTPLSADDVLFGNVFARPLKLPWGFGAVLKFMHLVDPTLEHDLASRSTPWALSPLIATMPYLEHTRLARPADAAPAFPPARPVGNDVSQLLPAARARTTDRRALFRDPARRREVVFGPEDLITADFCYDYLRFGAQGVELRLPGGLSIDMMKYWDGQRVPFVCCERRRPGAPGGEPWGRVLWCVVIEAVDEGGDEDEEGGDGD